MRCVGIPPYGKITFCWGALCEHLYQAEIAPCAAVVFPIAWENAENVVLPSDGNDYRAIAEIAGLSAYCS